MLPQSRKPQIPFYGTETPSGDIWDLGAAQVANPKSRSTGLKHFCAASHRGRVAGRKPQIPFYGTETPMGSWGTSQTTAGRKPQIPFYGTETGHSAPENPKIPDVSQTPNPVLRD